MSRSNATERAADSEVFFDSLFLSHHEAVLRYCVRRLGPSEAEDAAADVFAVAWRRIGDVPRSEGSRAWLIGVAYRVVGNRFRARRRWVRLAERLQSEPEPESMLPPHADSDGQTLHLALNDLSRNDQELIRLSAWDGLSRDEIAYVLGIRVNAVDQRLHRARSRLRVRFDRIIAVAESSKPEEASI